MRIALLFLCLALTVATKAIAQNVDIIALGSGVITTPSLGVFTNGTTIRQWNEGSAGPAVGVDLWKRNNGLSITSSYSKTNSELLSTSGKLLDTWPLDRYEESVILQHRYFPSRRISPYMGMGAFGIILWGGPAPAHSNVNATGFDGWVGFQATGGMNIKLAGPIFLRTALRADFGNASTYGDVTYRSSQNLMLEPQAGLVWRVR